MNGEHRSETEHRDLGARLANEHGASNTAAVIQDPNSSHGDILRAAANDVGVDRLTEVLLEHPPEWSFHALRSVPDLGANEEALIRRAKEWQPSDQSTLSDAAGGAAEPAAVRGVSVSLVWGSVMYTCRFTMLWESAPNVVQPVAAYESPAAWAWSPKMDITYHSSFSFPAKTFELPKSPLNPGDPLWIRIAINAGVTADVKNVPAVYQPGGRMLHIAAGGTTLNPSFVETVV